MCNFKPVGGVSTRRWLNCGRQQKYKTFLHHECAPYLHTVVLQVDPGLLRLLLLQEFVGLDPSLSGLFRLWTTKPHLTEHIYV